MAIIKGDYVGIIIMGKKIPVDLEKMLVAGKDESDIAGKAFFFFYHGSQPGTKQSTRP